MFRCGNLPLHIETGRFAYPKIPGEQKLVCIVHRVLKMNFISLLNAHSMMI